jgi:hypothetical protein
MEFNCTVDWSECPGEPMVMYYPDGSGYPGCDASVDCIDYVEVNECEYVIRRPDHYYSDDQPEDWGDTTEWGYTDFSDRPGGKIIAQKWCHAELSGGAYVVPN